MGWLDGPADGWDLLSPDQQNSLMEEQDMLGESGGRSAKNRTGQGADRRNTQRERADIDPVREAPEIGLVRKEPPILPDGWVDTLMGWVAVISLIAFGVLGGIILAAWFGVIK